MGARINDGWMVGSWIKDGWMIGSKNKELLDG